MSQVTKEESGRIIRCYRDVGVACCVYNPRMALPSSTVPSTNVRTDYYKKVLPGSGTRKGNILPFTFGPLVLNPLVFSTRQRRYNKWNIHTISPGTTWRWASVP